MGRPEFLSSHRAHREPRRPPESWIWELEGVWEQRKRSSSFRARWYPTSKSWVTILVLWVQDVETMLTSRLHPRYTWSGPRKFCLWIALAGDSQTACLIKNCGWLAYQRGHVLIQTERLEGQQWTETRVGSTHAGTQGEGGWLENAVCWSLCQAHFVWADGCTS